MLVWFIVLTFFICIIIVLLTGSLQIKRDMSAHAPLKDFQKHLESRIPALMKLYRIPGCNIALVLDSKIVWTQAFGYADMESGRKMTTDTPMSVQSITKSVTAWGVMKLVEKGLIDLDTSLSIYLKSWQLPHSDFPVEKVTIRRLLNHTAGMPLGDFTDVYSPGEKMPSLQEKLTQEAILSQEPGRGFSYSNVGYHLLELLIEEVTGNKYSDFIRSEIFLPLKMGTATFEVDKDMEPFPPVGYDLSCKPVPVYLYPEKASGGLFSTAEDIARFVLTGMKENPVLKSRTIAQMYSSEVDKIGIYNLVFEAYGLGYYIETLPNGLLSISHGGQGNGIMTHFQAVPETGDAIVILTNSQRSWPFIAYLLSDWAHWRSFPSVGMGRIIWGQYGLSAIIGMIVSAGLLIGLKLVLARQKPKRYRRWLFQFIIAILLLGTLIWCACQKYLFLTSVFPVLSKWLERAVLFLSLILLISSILSYNNKK